MTRDTVQNPLVGGLEISGATNASRGTLGCIVLSKDGRPAILTNKHVVFEKEALSEITNNMKLMVVRGQNSRGNLTRSQLALVQQERAPVFQPAYKGRTNDETRVVAFVNIASNSLDAAVCELDEGVDFSPSILGSPAAGVPDYMVTGMQSPHQGQLVMKSGATTGLTFGRVTNISGGDIIIRHVFYNIVPIVSQFQTFEQTPVGGPGDSGALWVDANTREAVGLLYKGKYERQGTGHNYSVAKDICVVADKLGFTFLT